MSEPVDRKELAVQLVDGLLSAVYWIYLADDRWKHNSAVQVSQRLDELAERLLKVIDEK